MDKIQRGKMDKKLYIAYISLSIIGMLVCDLLYDTPYISQYIAFFCVVHLCATVLLTVRYTKTLLNFYNIFIGLVYMFHMGQVIIKVIFVNYDFIKLNLYGVQGKLDFVDGACFAVRAIVFLTMGGMIHAYAYRNDDTEEINDEKMLSVNAKIKAKNKIKSYVQMYPEFIIATTLPVHMIMTLRKIIAMMKGTYFDIFEVSEPGIIAAYSDFFVIGIVLFMLKYKNDMKKVGITYILTCGYFVMTMLTGSRGKAVIYMIFFTWLACKLLKELIRVRIKTKYIIIACVIILFGLTFLSAISTVRDRGALDPISMAKEMISRSNVVASTLEEFGGTLYTVIEVRLEVPKYAEHAYGKTYVESLACILPDIGGRFSEINADAVFLNHFKSDYLGGSIIGELYYNFGEYAILVAAVIGYIMSLISKRIEYVLKNEKYMEFGCYVMVFTCALWWVRDCFNAMCRNVVWAIAYIYVINFILKLYNKKKSGNADEKDSSNNS